MKKLLLAVLLLGGMTAQANEVTYLTQTNETGIRYNQPQSISFTERGIKFVVFTDGTMDFTPIRKAQNYGRRGYGNNAPGHTYGVTFPYSNRGFIKYDRWGAIIKVGRNYIGYNRYGKTIQIGSVNLRYRRGKLVRVGDMQIVYNRKGQVVNLIGYVHHDHDVCGVCGINGCTTNHFDYSDGQWNDYNYRGNNQDWYSRNKKIKKNKKSRIRNTQNDHD